MGYIFLMEIWNIEDHIFFLNHVSGEGHLSGLRGQMSEKKRTFERQKSGHLSEMKNNPFQQITCIPVN